MKTLITISIAVFLLASCEKNTYKCTCKTSGFFTTPSQSEYTIVDTKRKATKQCKSGNSKSDGNFITASSANCELH